MSGLWDAGRARRVGWIALVAVAALVLVACGRPDDPSLDPSGADQAGPGTTDAPQDEDGESDGDGDVQVRVWTFLSPEGTSPREVVLNDLIAAFEEENPGVDVVVEAQPFEELESGFISAAQRDQAPDVIFARDSFLYLLEEADTLIDLGDHLSPEFADEALPDMFEIFTEKAVFDGARVALPIWPTPAQVLFYREDVLQEAGYDAPPLEWDAFKEAMAGLSDGSQYGLGLPMNDTGVTPYLMLLNGFGEDAFDPLTGRFDLLGPESLQVAETLRELAVEGTVPSDAITSTGQDIQDQFATGRYSTAMAFGPRFSAYEETAAGFDPATLRVSAWPSFGSETPSALMGPYWNVGVSASSDHPDEATAFVESLFSVEASTDWAEVAGQVPDRRSVLDDPFFETDEGRTITAFVEIIDSDGAQVLPQEMEDVTRVANVLNTAVQRLIGTEEDIEEILADTQSELGW